MPPLPPATLEGWYVLHQLVRLDREEAGRILRERAAEVGSGLARLRSPEEGWSAYHDLVGGRSDWLVVHLRPTLDEVACAGAALLGGPLGPALELRYDFLSVTEAGLYRASAELASEVDPASEEFRERLARRLEEERESPYVRGRLYPELPQGMPYLSFYPMSKRRQPHGNWYTLSIEERSRLMLAHGTTGRRYAGRVSQMITGAIGLDDWEWGVTLFAADPLDFKRIVTEMRYDEASARYADFGRFFTGIRFDPAERVATLAETPGGA